MVSGAKPDDIQWAIIPFCVVPFCGRTSAYLARLARDLPSPDVDSQIRSRDVLSTRFWAERVSSAPFSVVSSMAGETVATTLTSRCPDVAF